MKKIRVGIIGTGIGATMHLHGFKLHHKFEVVGIYGRNKTKVEKIAKKYKIKNYSTVHQLISSPEIDLVSIASIPKFHFKQAVLASKFNKRVILEKPMCMNEREAFALSKIFKKKGLFNAIVHEHRFDPAKEYLKNIIKQDKLGEVRSVEIYKDMTYWHDPILGRKFYWYSCKADGGGVTFSHLSHQIDFLMYIFGKVKLKWGLAFTECGWRYDVNGKRHKQTADDNCWACFEAKNNNKVIPCLINISATRVKKIDLININFSGGRYKIFSPQKIKIFNSKDKAITNKIPQKYLGKNDSKNYSLNSFVRLLDNYYSFYYQNGRKKITDFSDGVIIQKFLDQLISS